MKVKTVMFVGYDVLIELPPMYTRK